MKRIIFAIHGIRSPQKGNWVYDFTNFVKQDPRFKDDIPKPYYYGFVLAPVCVFPPFKYEMVKQLKTALRQIVSDNPNCDLNIIAHSYGTELSFWAIKTSGEDNQPIIMVDKMILISSVVSRYNEIPYNTTLRAGKIKELHCYCSFHDKICNFAPFGHSGCFGFSKDRYDKKCYPKPFNDLAIYNHQVEILGHSDYFKGTKYYKEWLDLIAAS